MPNLMEYHIARLKDKRAEVRIESVRELAQIGDPSILPLLEEYYRAEVDLTVKQALREAGITIYKRHKG